MGGRESQRGYLVQSISALLDAVDGQNDWIALSIEPNSDQEKVDIEWFRSGNVTEVQQIKSTQNQISKRQLEKWANELKNSKPKADKLTLVVFGNITPGAKKINKHEGVDIRNVRTIEIEHLLSVAIRRVDQLIVDQRNQLTSPALREQIVLSLVGKLSIGALSGERLSRKDLVNKVLEIIDECTKPSQAVRATNITETMEGITGKEYSKRDISLLRKALSYINVPIIDEYIRGCRQGRINSDSFYFLECLEIVVTGSDFIFTDQETEQVIWEVFRYWQKACYYSGLLATSLATPFATYRISVDNEQDELHSKHLDDNLNYLEDNLRYFIRLVNERYPMIDIDKEWEKGWSEYQSIRLCWKGTKAQL